MKTIAVKESTLQTLNLIKEKFKVKNVDEAIKRLMQKAEAIPSSRFGKQQKLKKFREEERAEFREL